MSQQLQITGGAKVRSLEGVITGSTGVLGSLPINASNGIPQLDVNGKILVSQLPNSVMEYKGTWNAATNTPTLADGTGNQGDVYLCNVAGTVNFGSGPISFVVGDQVIYSGTIWQKASGATGTVTSVAVTESGDALTITGSPITTSGTINIGFAGSSAQYVAGDGSLINFPTVVTQAQNLVTEVYNNSGATMTKGTVVYINGGQGNLPTIAKAIATGDSTSAQTYGVVRTDITNMNNGYVTVIGNLDNLDTQAYAAGTQLYLSSTTAGAWTSVKQYAPAHLVYVGIVVRSHPTQGVVEIRIQNGFELDELHDVSAQTPTNNQGLFYNSSNSLWENKSIATALGYTPISLTSLSATSPLSYNNTTGAFSISQASGSVNGFLSSTDWTTFNNKQNALTNPITGTGASGQIAYFNGTTTQTGSAFLTWDNTDGILSTNSIYNFNNTTNAYMLSSNGENIGSIFNVASAKWSLGYGTSTTALGTPALTWDTSGRVGIGTTSPTTRLHVAGDIQSTTGVFLANTGGYFMTLNTLNGMYIDSANYLTLNTNGLERVRISSAGNFGIGTSSPSNLLDVNGTFRATGAATFSSNIAVGTTSAGANVNVYSSSYGANGLFQGFGTDGAMKLQMGALGNSEAYIYANTGCKLSLFSGGNTTMTLASGGNVGIGTTSPSEKLDVVGGAVAAGNGTIRTGITYSSLGLIGTFTNHDLGVITNGTERMRISSTGAATFSSSVTAGSSTSSGYATLNLIDSGTGSARYASIRKNYDSPFDLRIRASNSEFAAPIVFDLSNAVEAMRITSGGDLCINATATSGSAKLYVNGLAVFGSVQVGSLGTGTVYSSSGTLTNTNPSDKRLKENITPITYGLNEILKLNPVSFDWKNDNNKNKQFGFIAQEVQEVMPEAVIDGEYLGLEKDAIYTALINAIKELEARLKTLENK
jgi:hypothetical protein